MHNPIRFTATALADLMRQLVGRPIAADTGGRKIEVGIIDEVHEDVDGIHITGRWTADLPLLDLGPLSATASPPTFSDWAGRPVPADPSRLEHEIRAADPDPVADRLRALADQAGVLERNYVDVAVEGLRPLFGEAPSTRDAFLAGIRAARDWATRS